MQRGMFIGDKQLNLFRTVSEQLVQRWMNVNILYFKLNINNIKTNIYGQPKYGKKQFYKGLQFPCLVFHTEADLEFNDLYRYDNTTVFKALKSTLIKLNLFPQVGDIILWNKIYWQIGNVTSEQLIGGDSDSEWTYVLRTAVQSDSKVKQLLKFTNEDYKYQKQE